MAEIYRDEGFDEREAARGSGCGTAAVLTLGVIWAVLGSVLALFIGWSLEQALFEGSLPVADVRWLVMLIFGLAMILPFTIIARLMRVTRAQQIFRTWWLAAVPALLLIPARLLGLTDSQPVALFQAFALLIFFIGLWFWMHSRGISISSSSRGVWIALAVAGAIAIPWVLWGALGSVVDTLLALLVGLLFGAVSGLLLTYSLLEGITPTERISSSNRNPWMDALVAFVMLLILVTGVFQNGIQWLMAMTVPIFGLAVVGLSHYGRIVDVSAWLAPALLIGLGTASPLMFIDPDELSLVISSGASEMIAWASQAGWAALLLGIAAGLILLVMSKSFHSASGRSLLTWIAAAAIWVAVAAVYFLFGQPGFYGERIFIILENQADVSAAASMPDYDSRRTFVYRTLVEHANTTQVGLRADLDRFGMEYTPYYLINAIEVQAGPLLKLWLSNNPDVGRILDSPILRPLPEVPPASEGAAPAPQQPDWNLLAIHAPQVWNEGITGAGIVVGQSDSGVQGDHPELADSYRGQEMGGNDYNWFDPWYHTIEPHDIGGHGTHTLGSVLGNSVGVAPDATWIGCVNLARNLGNPPLYLECMQFMLAPFPQGGNPFTDGEPALGAHVLNNSWGCPEVEGCDPETFQNAVTALRDAGVFVVVSAGNAGYGGCGSLKDPPAIYDAVYSVGAIGPDGQLATFSSIGPVTVDGSDRLKPDIVAPGVDVLSAYPNNSYSAASGTSMAGPHVAGVVALMWSANPNLIGDIERTTEILNTTSQPYQGAYPECITNNSIPNPAVGYGLVDAEAAVRLALGE